MLLLALFDAVAVAADRDRPPNYSVAAPPAWVVDVPYDSAAAPPGGQASQYLLVDHQIDGRSSQKTRYRRYVTRALNAEGVTDNSQIRFSFSPVFEQLTLHSISVIREGERRDVTASVEPRFISREDSLEDGIEHGYLSALYNIPDVRRDDIISYSYSISGINPIFDGRIFGMLDLNWSIEVDKISVRLLTENPELRVKLQGVDAQFLTRSQSSAGIEYHYEQLGTEAVLEEGDHTYATQLFATLQYSDFESWADVNRWAQALYAVDDESEQRVAELLQTLRRDHSEAGELLSASIDFVQESVRYLGLEFGENSHRPHAPSEVLANRYGDCKDKSVLLMALLRHQGIEAVPALVSTRDRDALRDMLPSPGVFDHVITRLVYRGTRYWVDGTSTYQAGSIDQMGQHDYGYALPIGEGFAELEDMYREANTSKVSVSERLRAVKDFDAPVEYKIVTRFEGRAAEFQRYRFSNKSLAKIQRDYLDYLSYYYEGIEPQGQVSYSDDERNNRFEVVEHYRIADFWQREEDSIVAPVNILSFKDYLKRPDSNRRYSDFYLRSPVQVEGSYELHYPLPVEITLTDPPLERAVGPVHFYSSESYTEGVFRHSGNLLIASTDLKRQDFKRYVKLRNELLDNWDFTLHVSDPAKTAGLTELLQLKRSFLHWKAGVDDLDAR